MANIPVFVQQAEARIYNSVQLPALRKNVTGALSQNNQYLSLPDDYLSTFSLAVLGADGAYQYLLNKDVNYIREAYPFPGSTGFPKYYALFGPQYINTNELSFIVGPTPDDSYQVEMHYFFYPPTIVQGQISSISLPTGGSLYTNGVYQNVLLTSGSGANASADIVISGGSVVSCTIRFGGNFYVAGDILSCSSLGSTGTGFSITVNAVSNSAGTSWLGDNYDPVLFYGAMREAILFMKGEQDLVTYYQKMYEEALGQLKRLGDGLERGDSYRDGQTKLAVNT